ncbi:hypothetical protein [Fibrella forsythiae]|uniref:Uncharacterized protein n=1 Tax=Fibrella forsythiae TaxID=2817061 RepID=A0ABS3JNJ1_9BACT|nr:hypothetical protein [Fibrella forsythiae]MBO0951577.1 hypothetical protein [Fibrella forsythiae]
MRILTKEPLFISRKEFAEYIYTVRGTTTAYKLYKTIQDANQINYDLPLTVEQVATYFNLTKERIMRQLGYDPDWKR